MGEEFLAITERSIYVRLGESDTAIRVEVVYDQLAPE